MGERVVEVEKQLEVLESLKPRLGRFIQEKLYSWGLGEQDIILVDEAGFGYTGIPIFGPELQAEIKSGGAHIDIAVREEKYTGPMTEVPHPIKFNIPSLIVKEILDVYGITVCDLIKGRSFFDLSLELVNLGEANVLVPEPVAHVEMFANDTILNYTIKQMGEEKIKEWFDKLVMIRDVSQAVGRNDVAEMAGLMIQKSRERWKDQSWI